MQAPSLFGPGESSGDGARSADTAEPAVPVSTSAARSSTSLYRKYRPNSFDAIELVGQDHIVKTLRNAVALDRVAHAYLFCGPRGTGKTTTARLLAKAVNCLDPDPARRPCNACANCLAINAGASPDIIEIDAASNRGIDDIRDLRDRIRFAPAQLPSKVYIIDEAHQITGAAANAFLKTLEEPPAHSRFILATTDPEELLPTIVSRCQRFEFRRIAASDMVLRLRTVADLEGIRVDDEALEMMARHATGSLRDGLGLLEQLALQASAPDQGPATISANDVRAALGLSRNERVEGIVQALAEQDPGAALGIIQSAVEDGEDPRQLNRQLVSYVRLLLLQRSGATGNADERAQQLAGKFSLGALAQLARRFSEIDFNIKHAPYPQLPLEVAVVEAASTPAEASPAPASPPREVWSPAPPEERGNAPRPTPLRDRVRNAGVIREAPATPSSAVQSNPVTPLRPNQSSPPQIASRDIAVEQIADLWPAVRADVKALNRRIEALLSEVDPVAISGNQITLAVPYPFHRDKLNSDEVRETVGSVLSRLLDRQVSLNCILRGEVVLTPGATPTVANVSLPPVPQNAGDPTAVDDDRVQSRIRAAKNIFDADELDPAEAQPVPGNSSPG